jgi:hypothetical protein
MHEDTKAAEVNRLSELLVAVAMSWAKNPAIALSGLAAASAKLMAGVMVKEFKLDVRKPADLARVEVAACAFLDRSADALKLFREELAVDAAGKPPTTPG